MTLPRASARVVCVVAFLLFWSLWIATLASIRLRHADLDHSTLLADARVIVAGRYYDEHGILSNWALPAIETYQEAGDEPTLYYTYPPGRFWMHQLGKTLGLSGPAGSRVLPMLASSLAALFAAFAALKLTRSPWIAAATGFFFTFNSVYTFYFDSLSESARQATLMASLAAWLAFENAPDEGARRRWLVAAASAVFIDAWFTLEHLIFVPLFAGIRAVMSRDPRLRRAVVVVICVIGLALVLRAVEVVLAVGFETGTAEFASRVRVRSGLEQESALLSAVLRILPRLGLGEATSLHNPSRFPMLAPAVLAPAALLLLLAVRRWRDSAFRPVRAALLGGVSLLAVGCHWALLMTEHAAVHPHTTLVLVPGGALMLGGLAAAGFAAARSSPAASRATRWLLPLLSLTLICGFAAEMRYSRTLNLLAPLDDVIVRQVRYREDQARIARLAARQLRNADRVVVSAHVPPNLAAVLEIPFQFEREGSFSDLAAAEYLWLSGDAPSRVAAARRLYGFPLRLAGVLGHNMLFSGAGRPGLRTQIAYHSGVQIPAVDVSRTLGGDFLTLQLLVVHGASRRDARAVEAIWEVVDEAGAIQWATEGEPALLTEGEAMLSQQFLVSALPADGAVRVRLVDPSGEALRIDRAVSLASERLTLQSETATFSVGSLLESWPGQDPPVGESRPR